MSLSVGDRLGPYEILAPIGKGGMGEVYRARDTRLGREVAIKVSDEQFTERFAREARSIAALNHTNICHLYDVGQNYLVMELVEGETLSGPIELSDALPVIRQLIDGIEAAHDKNIVHRDLKPANIKITPEGVVKILDFGLAKATGLEPQGNPENSPTLTMGATASGTILGTAAYMSPEQAKGKSADRRSDIWSFGVVVYELLAGKRPFGGETVVEILGTVINKTPDWNRVPPEARRLLEWCLEKERKQRLASISDARRMLEQAPVVSAPSQSRFSWVAWAVAALAVPIALAFGFVHFREVREDPRVSKTSILPPDKTAYGIGSLPAISPDGRHVAFAVSVRGQTGLWVRDLDALDARLLPGTEGAQYPFWSPDSRFVAFQAGRKLKKVDISGGTVLTLCDSADNFRGGTWNKDDAILFQPAGTGGLYRVPAAGGKPALVTTPDRAREETSDRFPWFLPDGRHFLFTGAGQNIDKITIYVGSLDSKERRPILTAASNAVYAPPGYLLFMREQTLMAQPFDSSSFRTTGEATPVAEQVNFFSGPIQGDFSASQNGALIYRLVGVTGNAMQLTWLDRSGKATGTVGAPAIVVAAAISPDGATVAAAQNDAQTLKRDIWLHDLARGTATRFTLNARQNDFFVWSPDGKYIAFRNWAAGIVNVSLKATDGTGDEEILDDAPGDKSPTDWSKDGRYVIEGRFPDSRTKYDIWLFPRFGDRKPVPYLATEFSEAAGKLSPDGHWLAFKSDETNRPEIYVSTFPAPRARWQVSTGGVPRTGSPIWSRDGRELFFVSADRKMMAVEIKPGAKFEAGVPKALFEVPEGAEPYFDIGKDGRFLLALLADPSASQPMTVVLNWQAGLKK